jgi:phosphate starvation-inducible membrane PsiE
MTALTHTLLKNIINESKLYYNINPKLFTKCLGNKLVCIMIYDSFSKRNNVFDLYYYTLEYYLLDKNIQWYNYFDNMTEIQQFFRSHIQYIHL